MTPEEFRAHLQAASVVVRCDGTRCNRIVGVYKSLAGGTVEWIENPGRCDHKHREPFDWEKDEPRLWRDISDVFFDDRQRVVRWAPFPKFRRRTQHDLEEEFTTDLAKFRWYHPEEAFAEGAPDDAL